MRLKKQTQRRIRGFTLIELLITVSIVGVVLSIGALNLKPLNNDARHAAGQLAGFLKLTRAKAMSTTSAYKLDVGEGSKPGQMRVFASRASRCGDPSAAWVPDEKLQMELPEKVKLSVDDVRLKFNWANLTFRPVCFDSRGFSDAYLLVRLEDDRAHTAKVELLLGGAARVTP